MNDDEKLEALRKAIDEGFAAIDAGDYITINSREELKAFMESVRPKPSQEKS